MLINADLWRRQSPAKEIMFEIDNYMELVSAYIYPLIYILTPDLKLIRTGASVLDKGFPNGGQFIDVLPFDCNPGEVRY